ncbi:transmembrane protein 222-like [Sycon ciliatum]|uniref:transmembrane protein 222-like n=1 Tax=Sycon ciliatum TaxID=27933 RepID=UPI0020AD2988|eukprot:scpid79510/ scgid10576/ Transmembrane protein 222
MGDDWAVSSSADLPDMEADKLTKQDLSIDTRRHRYPFSIVWTPIPCLTWLFPFIGHMGICMSNGVIRDFAGPYFVSEDNMAFGNPVKYWQLNPGSSDADRREWDNAVHQASETYKGRMHNLLCDNCHSHAAMALNLQLYDGSSRWNMVKLALYMMIYGRYTSWSGVVKTWLPFLLCVGVILLVVFLVR